MLADQQLTLRFLFKYNAVLGIYARLAIVFHNHWLLKDF